MLNAARVGKLTDEYIAAFKDLARPIDWGDGIIPTEL